MQNITSLIKQQKYSEAIEQCRELCQQSPDNTEAWLMLANLLIQTGDPDEARQCCNHIIEYAPEESRAYYSLGVICTQQNKIQEAITAYQKAIKLNKDFAIALSNLGMIFNNCGKLDKAFTLLARAYDLQPNNPMILNNMGICMRHNGNLAGAIRQFEHAIQSNPEYTEAYYNLAHAAQFKGEPDKAISLFRQVISQSKSHIPAYISLAQIYSGVGQTDEAETVLSEALAIAPAQPDIISAMAGVLEKKGQFDKAMSLLEPILDKQPVPASAAIILGVLARRLDRQLESIPVLEQALNHTDPPDSVRQELLFRLGGLLTDTGQYQHGFSRYQQANALFKIVFDKEIERKRFAALTTVFNNNFMKRAAHSGCNGEKMIFIVGMPRSGTSLAEQVIAAHPLCHGGGELPYLADIVGSFQAYFGNNAVYPAHVTSLDETGMTELASSYLERINNITHSHDRVIDKTPHNFMHLGLIELLFPDARIIHCCRDPRDTCLSIYTHNFNANHPYAAGLDTLGWYYNQYINLMRHWKKVLHIPVLELQYEDMVTDTEAQVRRLVDFCDLPWDERCLKFHESERVVNTPSYDQVRQPVYTSSIGRWKLFEQQLHPLITALGPELSQQAGA